MRRENARVAQDVGKAGWVQAIRGKRIARRTHWAINQKSRTTRKSSRFFCSVWLWTPFVAPKRDAKRTFIPTIHTQYTAQRTAPHLLFTTPGSNTSVLLSHARSARGGRGGGGLGFGCPLDATTKDALTQPPRVMDTVLLCGAPLALKGGVIVTTY
jgi:hypothetical protein